MLSSSDPTFVIADAMYWSIIETNVGILAASIPSFNIILNKFVQSASQANSKYSYSHSNSKGQGLQMTPMGSHKNHYTEVGSSKDGAPTQKGHGDSEEELVLQHQGITVETRVDVESKSIG